MAAQIIYLIGGRDVPKGERILRLGAQAKAEALVERGVVGRHLARPNPSLG